MGWTVTLRIELMGSRSGKQLSCISLLLLLGLLLLLEASISDGSVGFGTLKASPSPASASGLGTLCRTNGSSPASAVFGDLKRRVYTGPNPLHNRRRWWSSSLSIHEKEPDNFGACNFAILFIVIPCCTFCDQYIHFLRLYGDWLVGLISLSAVSRINYCLSQYCKLTIPSDRRCSMTPVLYYFDTESNFLWAYKRPVMSNQKLKTAAVVSSSSSARERQKKWWLIATFLVYLTIRLLDRRISFFYD